MTINSAPFHPLDNPIWNSLTSDMAYMAGGTALAKRWGDVAVAIADHSDAAFAELLALLQPGPPPILFEADPPTAIPGLTIHHRTPLRQMVCEVLPSEPDGEAEIATLTQADAQDIVELVALTQPGPFTPEAMNLGRFVGLRVDGRLAAVAGQRMNMTGYREICTVCTHPDFQGQGYAARVVSRIANLIAAEGKTPFLHFAPTNVRAQRVYERLGFRLRREVTIMVIGR